MKKIKNTEQSEFQKEYNLIRRDYDAFSHLIIGCKAKLKILSKKDSAEYAITIIELRYAKAMVNELSVILKELKSYISSANRKYAIKHKNSTEFNNEICGLKYNVLIGRKGLYADIDKNRVYIKVGLHDADHEEEPYNEYEFNIVENKWVTEIPSIDVIEEVQDKIDINLYNGVQVVYSVIERNLIDDVMLVGCYDNYNDAFELLKREIRIHQENDLETRYYYRYGKIVCGAVIGYFGKENYVARIEKSIVGQARFNI